MTVADHLSSLENCICISKSPDCGCQSEFEKAKEVKACVAVHSLRFLERVRELFFQHVVVASNDLLCQQLFAVFALSSILKVRTVLTKRVCALGCRALWLAPNIKADSSADVSFSSSISCH